MKDKGPPFFEKLRKVYDNLVLVRNIVSIEIVNIKQVVWLQTNQELNEIANMGMDKAMV